MTSDSHDADAPPGGPPAGDAPYRQPEKRPACARCGGELVDGGTFTKDGAVVCARCAALASIAEAEERAKGPGAPVAGAAFFARSWLRPRLLRRHGTAVSLGLGGVGLLGAPAAFIAFFSEGPWLTLVEIGYVLLMGGTLWAAVVVAGERNDALVRQARAPAAHPPAPGAHPPGVGATVGAAAGPAMVAAGCGGAALLVALVLAVAAVIAIIVIGWLFNTFILHGGH